MRGQATVPVDQSSKWLGEGGVIEVRERPGAGMGVELPEVTLEKAVPLRLPYPGERESTMGPGI